MHVHILGIGGTFMAGVAMLARAAGHTVTGSDTGLYPPMSTQLAEAGIEVMDGYAASHLKPAPDQVVIGNAMSRGNPAVEYALDAGLTYVSGPQWLAENVLAGRHVIAVAGTHGKTTTTSMLAHILRETGHAPGFLVGGIAADLGVSAALGEGEAFVVEADEYDTAFFDKRSKFVHYRPRTLILNNLEFDHADIFIDLAAIQRQFHHLLRTVPGTGCIVHNAQEPALDEVIAMGCWSPTVSFNEAAGWHALADTPDWQRLHIHHGSHAIGALDWSQRGAHNAANACAAIAAAAHVGVAPEAAITALSGFSGVKRRLELRGRPGDIALYDDFAHHPTAIRTTLAGLAPTPADHGRLLVVFEPRSNTMRAGVHEATLADSFAQADRVFAYDHALAWDLSAVLGSLGNRLVARSSVDSLVEAVAAEARPGDTVVVMSNGGFEGIHDKLLARLAV
ncbi:UDP-N-acetylmuramate:L-alanyl-gamma-D-glutamyl-meso-diaminopimelate ligase [Salinisphaera sp. Q1T1-3]|uniref:UDP-N-acetylmuramate:L-alanyl-gamma-D-glutamyl- meso-diaminopimelate ligase n=1 Tax=Salinisphaera sp. Q1T1-3 TaxID=2321229 RepID=UPI000E760A92|nr:UDP-N-acetylmuramate:L-alanyl-gamma-D-glutamyl-meso-diaminopimelate ligase [Salinisphaera sp. Q1T1-3]RJS92261.1 UDP-N-acetylmuramate:L-alanyl-gamma-D-glutamyl-meso-diaminopimelate ligase [Salinisphaera sp. Q1T1-3]